MSRVALDSELRPLKEILDRDNISEICINRPNEAWIEVKGRFERIDIPELGFDRLKAIADLTATYSNQEVSEKRPLLSATLPDGYRIQCVIPPACQPNTVVLSIRKQVISKLMLSDYKEMFSSVGNENISDQKDKDELRRLYTEGCFFEFVESAVKKRKNVIVSGGTSSGKTTFLNSLLSEVAENERIITIEDAIEVCPVQANNVRLLYSRGEQGLSNVGPTELLECCLRLRPDRILLSELRGKEAFSLLRAMNTGHDGSMTTIHADSPDMAISQIVLMVMQAGINLSRDEIMEYVKGIVDVIVQVKRDFSGRRSITEVKYYE